MVHRFFMTWRLILLMVHKLWMAGLSGGGQSKEIRGQMFEECRDDWSRLPCYVFENKNPDTNKLSWAINCDDWSTTRKVLSLCQLEKLVSVMSGFQKCCSRQDGKVLNRPKKVVHQPKQRRPNVDLSHSYATEDQRSFSLDLE